MGKLQYYNKEADQLLQLYLKEDPMFSEDPHFHDSIEFIIVTKGKLQCFLNDESYVLTEGDIFFSESYQTHHYRKLDENTTAIVLCLARDFISSFRTNYPGLTLPPLLNNKEANKEAINLARNWLNKEEKTILLNEGYSSLFISSLISFYHLIKRKNYEGDIFQKELLKYVHLHYTEDITLSSIAKDLGYTVEYCSKAFKKSLNCNFREYINYLRYKKAKDLLSDKTISRTQSEVLYMCGFNSPATYYRVKKELENR